jgi:ribosomal protein L19
MFPCRDCSHSPHLLEVKVLDVPGRKTYRRSKLYFLRDVQPKEYRVV